MATKVAKDETTDVLETLEPEVLEKTYEVGPYTFTQKPLSFFGKIEFFSVVGHAIEKVLSGGTTLNDLLDVPDYDPSTPLARTASEADVFVKAIASVVYNAPEILSELYCVILAVPRNVRAEVKEVIEENLTDEQGVEILDTFVEQNWEVMVDFFKEKMLPLATKIQEKVQG